MRTQSNADYCITRLKKWKEKEKSEQSKDQKFGWYNGEQEAIRDVSSSNRKIKVGGWWADRH